MKHKDIFWVHFGKVFASFSVILLHSAAMTVVEFNNELRINWWAGNIYDSMARTCVPIFFMISGYLLLGKEEPLATFFVKRIRKVLIPLIVWSFIFIAWKWYRGEEILFRTFYSLPFSHTYFHLWFLYALIGLYLYIPILRIFIKHASQHMLYYFVLLWFTAVAIIPYFETFHPVTSGIDLQMISGYGGYLVLGYLLGNKEINKKMAYVFMLLAAGSFFVTAYGTYELFIQNNAEHYDYFYVYLSPNVIFFSVATLRLIKYYSEKMVLSEKFISIIKSLSHASFGIYLIHPIVQLYINRFAIAPLTELHPYHSIFTIPIAAILLYFASFIIIYFLQKIPIVRECIP